MRKTLGALATLAGALALCGPSYAAGAVHYNAQGRAHHQGLHVPPPNAFGTKAKSAYYYTRGFGIDRSKNVSDFQHPSTGIYCILPSITLSGDNYPTVDIEWDTSLGFGLWAYWKDATIFSDCPSGYQEVTTYDLESGTAVLTDNVSFDWALR